MTECWETNPNNRPTFHEIVDITQTCLENNKVVQNNSAIIWYFRERWKIYARPSGF